VMLAESQILKPARELGFFVDATRGGPRRAAGKKGCAENHRENDSM
jgi:hypothetical protein